MKVNFKGKDSEPWEETEERNIEDAQAWAEETIKRFNAGLRPHEKPRELISVKVLDHDNNGYHDWRKRTNGMSVVFHGSIVDLMYCEKCGITGKRYGLSEHITRDSKYKAKKYETCHQIDE